MTRKRITMVLISLLLCVGGAQAQNVGAISGRVTDTSDAVIPGALVELKNVDTGFNRTVTADRQGRYSAPELPLGNYQLEASFSGFQRTLRSGVALTAGRDATVNFQLTIGEVQELITVVGDAPLVETTKAEMGALVTREQISELPLRNRDFSQLITLQAGTVKYRQTPSWAPSLAGSSIIVGYGARIAVSGARPTSNSFTLDGVDINDAQQLIPSGVDGSMLGVDAIREFKVLASNYSAQYGRAAGANLMAVSRSGTNQLHGSLFEYLRNDNLDAATWEENAFGRRKGELRRNQFGYSLGGPVKRDRLFFFTTYEGVRAHSPRTRIAQVPTTLARQGILPTGTVTVNSLVAPYLTLWPKATGLEGPTALTADYASTDVLATNANYVSARMDYQFHPNHSLFGRYTIDGSSFNDPIVIPLFATEDRIRNQYVTLEERSILSQRMINAVRLGFSRSAQFHSTVAINPPPPSLSFVTGRPFGGISVGDGITALQGFDGNTPTYYVLNTYQVYDDVVWERSQHSLKFGMAIERMIFNRMGVSRRGGVWQFRNFRDFLLNNTPRRLRIMGPDRLADPFRTILQTLFAAYLQDDFRVRSNLTLNLGLRYEFTTVPTEKHGRLANLRKVTDPAPTVGNPLYPNPTLDNFSPRVGFAWDPTGSGRTSLRGGTGIFFEPLLTRMFRNTVDRQPPFWLDIDPPVAQLSGLFPNLDDDLERLATGPQAIHATDFHLNSPYTIQSSLAIQHMVASKTVAEIGYTWTRGIHLSTRADMAIPVPVKLADGRWFFPEPTNVNYPLINPNFSRLDWYYTGSFSNYHGLRATLTRTVSEGLHFQAAYTWSKAMDTLSENIGALGFPYVQNPFDVKGDYALADFHVTHNLVTNFTYDLPFGANRAWGKGLGGVAGAVLGGWQISGVFSAQSGMPFSILGDPAITHILNRGASRPDLKAGGDPNPVFGDRDHVLPRLPGFLWFDKTQFVNQQPGFYGNLGRNTVIGPGAVSMDFSVLKNTSWGEGRNIQFRAEFFNLFNTPQFAQPNSFTTSAQIGRISGTVGNTARQIQLALRVTF